MNFLGESRKTKDIQKIVNLLQINTKLFFQVIKFSIETLALSSYSSPILSQSQHSATKCFCI